MNRAKQSEIRNAMWPSNYRWQLNTMAKRAGNNKKRTKGRRFTYNSIVKQKEGGSLYRIIYDNDGVRHEIEVSPTIEYVGREFDSNTEEWIDVLLTKANPLLKLKKKHNSSPIIRR